MIPENQDLNYMLSRPPLASITIAGIERPLGTPPGEFFEEMVRIAQDVVAGKPGAKSPGPFMIVRALLMAGDPFLDWDRVRAELTIEQLFKIVGEYVRQNVVWALNRERSAGSA